MGSSYNIFHFGIVFMVFVVFPLFYIIPLWKIVSKAGYAGAWSLLSLVPFVNFIMLWVFAFSSWPRERN